MPVTESGVVDGARRRRVRRSSRSSRILTYLAALERSPNTQRAYATSLKLWFEFLDTVDVGWAEVSVDDVARFVSWLRAPADNVIVLDGGHGPAVAGDGEPSSGARCSGSTSITPAPG